MKLLDQVHTIIMELDQPNSLMEDTKRSFLC